ncbi:MAG TPA: hypothetical protein VK169_04495 [Saprospiraceae bacterium]|nr:hypothetical protein [Saprospiraceae bacterium]
MWTITKGWLELNGSSELVIKNNSNLEYIEILESDQISDLKVIGCANLKSIKVNDQNKFENLELDSLGSAERNIFISFINCNIDSAVVNLVSCCMIKFSKCNIRQFEIHSLFCDTFSFNKTFLDSKVENSELEIFKLTNSIIKEFNFCKFESKIYTILRSCILFMGIEDCTINRFSHLSEGFNNIEFSSNEKLFRRSIHSNTIFYKRVKFGEQFKFKPLIANPNWNVSKIILDNIIFECESFINLNYDGNNMGSIPIRTVLKVGIISCSDSLNMITDDNKGQFNLKIIFSSISDGILQINKLNISNLLIKGFNSKLATTFKECTFKEIKFDDFDNKNIVKFSNSHEIKKLVINNSDLNDVIFRPLNITGNNIAISNDSFIGGMKIYGSNIISLDNSGLDISGKQEFYRQLKQAAKNSYNKFAELEYKAKEFENYQSASKRDNFLLYVNAISKHGLDYVCPILVMLGINLLIWIPFTTNLYTNDFGGFHVACLFDTLGLLFEKYLPSYFILLNPVSRLSEFNSFIKMPTADVSWFVGFIFIFSKIVNSVLIYQIVSAFRKYASKD